MKGRARWYLPLVGSALIVLLALLVYTGLNRAQATTLEDFGAAPAFALTDQQEQPLSDADLRGTVVVANFIYTNCTDICPTLSLQMQMLQARLQQEGLLGQQVQLLSFTVDPARDTPAVLRAYAERHQANAAWRFLTGAEEVIVPLVVDGFHQGVTVLPPTATTDAGDHAHEHGYEVMHGGRFVLIDQQGRIRAYYGSEGFTPDQVVADIRQLLR